MAHLFADETSSEVLDELYRVSKEYTRSRPQAQRVIKDLIKVAVKVAVLHQWLLQPQRAGPGNQLSPEAAAGRHDSTQLPEVDFTLRRRAGQPADESAGTSRATGRHLTPKSRGRIRHVLITSPDAGLLTALYGPDYTQHLGKICGGLRKLLDEGKL